MIICPELQDAAEGTSGQVNRDQTSPRLGEQVRRNGWWERRWRNGEPVRFARGQRKW